MAYTSERSGKNGTFLDGIRASYRAVLFVGDHKSLLLYFIVPFFINAALLLGIFYFSYTTLIPWLEGVLTGEAWYLEALRFVLVPVIMIITAVIIVLLYSLTGNIITSPFNDLLTGSVEKRLGVAVKDEPLSLSLVFADMKDIVLSLIRLFGMMVSLNIALAVVNIIPVVGSLLYPILGFMNTVFFLGLQFLDYPMIRRRYSFWKKIRLAWSHKLLVMGVGTSFFLMSFIPLIGFLGLNIAAVAATIVFVDYIMPSLKDEKMNNNLPRNAP